MTIEPPDIIASRVFKIAEEHAGRWTSRQRTILSTRRRPLDAAKLKGRRGKVRHRSPTASRSTSNAPRERAGSRKAAPNPRNHREHIQFVRHALNTDGRTPRSDGIVICERGAVGRRKTPVFRRAIATKQSRERGCLTFPWIAFLNDGGGSIQSQHTLRVDLIEPPHSVRQHGVVFEYMQCLDDTGFGACAGFRWTRLSSSQRRKEMTKRVLVVGLGNMGTVTPWLTPASRDSRSSAVRAPHRRRKLRPNSPGRRRSTASRRRSRSSNLTSSRSIRCLTRMPIRHQGHGGGADVFVGSCWPTASPARRRSSPRRSAESANGSSAISFATIRPGSSSSRSRASPALRRLPDESQSVVERRYLGDAQAADAELSPDR